MPPLQHLPLGLIPYLRASLVQSHLIRAHLNSKANPSLPTPPPTILTAQFHPIYTSGRRDASRLSAAQIAHLTSTGADYYPAMRGGQTTFHGPGQVVAYPILDLRAHGLGARAYVCLLEGAVRATCAKFGVDTIETPAGTPGVWVSEKEKVAALGVQLRRFVSGHGVGLNVNTDLRWFERIVACGLEGKRVVSFESLGKRVGVEEVERVLVRELAERLDGVDGVREVGLEELGIEDGLEEG